MSTVASLHPVSLFTRKYPDKDCKDAHCSVGGKVANFSVGKAHVACQGFWLLTTHCSIYSHNSSNSVFGYTKTLGFFFYEGRDSEEHETDYVLQEYTMVLRLDEWILCGIYKKEKMVDEVMHFGNIEIMLSFAVIMLS
ncbi:hypothetical protein MKX03_018089 [Papaver bracteatum]|nr:hypothetical protein MKX03_018089 [Papaver bracteatum]